MLRIYLEQPKSPVSGLQGLAARTDAKIIVVLIHGGPVAIEWLEASPRVSAIVTAWMPGQVRPSASLPTFPAQLLLPQLS